MLGKNATPKKVRTGSQPPLEDEAPWDGPTWQYATVTAQSNSETLIDRLNEMGARGWQAVSVADGAGLANGVMTRVLLQRRVR